jgi:2-oxoisovalerate dehydrogenase E1 component
MRGHEEASGTKYVPPHLFEEWKTKDPIDNYEAWLLNEGILNPGDDAKIRKEFLAEIEAGLEEVFAEEEIVADAEEEMKDMFAEVKFEQVPPSGAQTEKRLVDAISDGLRQSMQKHSNLIIMGQDVAEYGGVFKITDNFYQEFGKERVRNTPITESSILGAGYGLAINGHKAVVEMQFADFVTCGFNQIVNNLAKSHYRWAQPADVVVRMPTGAGVQAGPFHSQSNEAWFYHVPGLKIYYPSNPFDAKGLLATAINDPNPVLFFEHKFLYRSVNGMVPDAYYTLPEGQAAVHNHGDDICIITYGWGVHQALKYVTENQIKARVVDLRTLMPWDKETVYEQVKATGKVMVLTEDTLTGSIASDISAWIMENCFRWLDAPVKRLGSMDTPVPLAKTLEDQFLPWSRLKEALEELRSY